MGQRMILHIETGKNGFNEKIGQTAKIRYRAHTGKCTD